MSFIAVPVSFPHALNSSNLILISSKGLESANFLRNRILKSRFPECPEDGFFRCKSFAEYIVRGKYPQVPNERRIAVLNIIHCDEKSNEAVD